MWCTDQSTAAFPMCLQKTLALLLHWRKWCCCILMYYIESIFACIIMTLNGHIFISWEAQSSWKCAGCFSCSFFPPRVLETFWGRVFLLPHLLPDVCQVVRRPQSLPPLQRRFLALPCCCWLPVSGEAAKTTNKTHQQTDTVMFVWLQPRLWHSHKNKVALFIMRMMMVTSVNICRDSRTKQRTHKDSDVTLDKCNDEMMQWWVKLKDVWWQWTKEKHQSERGLQTCRASSSSTQGGVWDQFFQSETLVGLFSCVELFTKSSCVSSNSNTENMKQVRVQQTALIVFILSIREHRCSV